LNTFYIDPEWPAEIVQVSHINNSGDVGNKEGNTWGNEAGFGTDRVQAHRPSLPSILLANVQYLENKLDHIRARI